MPRLLKVGQAAAEIGVGRSKAYEWIASGRLRSVRIDGMRRVPAEAVDEFIESLASGFEEKAPA